MNDVIPRLLAESLVQTLGDHAEILVGVTPSSFPLELLTDEFELLGGLDLRSNSVTVLLARATDPESAREKMVTSMTRAGFDPPPGGRARGFVCDGRPDFRQYTKGDVGIMLRFMHRPPHGTLVHVMVGPRMDRDEHIGRLMRERFEVETPMPQLHAPVDRRVSDNGGGSSGDFTHIRCSIEPQMNPDLALTHYHAQLIDQGWVVVGSHGDERSASACYMHDDPTGLRWSGMLAIAPREDNTSTVINFALASLAGRKKNRGSSVSLTAVD